MSDVTGAHIGMIGMAVMGRNLALNMADHDFRVAVWNREPEMTEAAVAESEGRLQATESLADLVAALERPRRLFMMIAAGKPVDIVTEQLIPLLEQGDIIIDGGNSWFEDTRRREKKCAEAGIRFFGVGVSGGEEGARHGPSIMPGGDRNAYPAIQPILEAIAARTDSGPCVTYIGPDGAGHFVKMVHNGIEYADMQLIAEVYDILKRGLGLHAGEIGEIFTRWNQGPLESFLIELTGKVLRAKDPSDGHYRVDKVLDKAGQKGTGKWTVQVALDLGISIPSIAAAIDARVVSSMRPLRLKAAERLAGPGDVERPQREALIHAAHDALLAAKIIDYSQGMALIQAGSAHYGWGIDLSETARIWKGGCIIRARLLDTLVTAYRRDPNLPSLLFDESLSQRLRETVPALREVVGTAHRLGIPVPALGDTLSYYDGLRTASLPQNLTQAQRDAFGAHTYQLVSDPDGPFIHTDWLD